ncbi:MAG: PfkB family carbohydrate kinase [Chloroflexota bacterium]
MTVRYVSHGIILDDIVFPDGRTQMAVVGGGGPQTVWGMAAAVGDGAVAGIVAALNNAEPETTLAILQAARINLDGVYRNELPTPRAWQILENDGLRRHLWRVPVETLGTQLRRGLAVAPPSYHNATWFHWGIHPGDADRDIAWAQELRQRGIKVCLEPFMPSPQPLTPQQLRALMDACDMFSVNRYEAERIVGTSDTTNMLERYRDAGAHYLLVRRDTAGADCWDLTSGAGVHVPAYATAVVDVVGAGNAFTGAFIAALDMYNDIEIAACHASAASSYTIEQVGIPPVMPDERSFAERVQALTGVVKRLTR